MKKVKGIVLESNNNNLILLTHEGEYRKLPSRGKHYPVGADVEVNSVQLPPNFYVFAAAAAILLVVTFTLLWQVNLTRPSAYLALDINPSILLLLDKDGLVMSAEALNNEGKEIDKTLELKDLQAETALEYIIQQAGLHGYLSEGRENIVLLTLASPQGYPLDETVLQQAAAKQLLSLEVDSYLKISTTTPTVAREARQNNVSLNALLLAEELAAKGLFPLKEGLNGKGEGGTEAGRSINVQKLLEQVLPQHVFTEKEFIPGDSSKKNTEKPGAPMPSPGQVRESDPAGFTPPGQGKETGPPITPPGQANRPQ